MTAEARAVAELLPLLVGPHEDKVTEHWETFSEGSRKLARSVWQAVMQAAVAKVQGSAPAVPCEEVPMVPMVPVRPHRSSIERATQGAIGIVTSVLSSERAALVVATHPLEPDVGSLRNLAQAARHEGGGSDDEHV